MNERDVQHNLVFHRHVQAMDFVEAARTDMKLKVFFPVRRTWSRSWRRVGSTSTSRSRTAEVTLEDRERRRARTAPQRLILPTASTTRGELPVVEEKGFTYFRYTDEIYTYVEETAPWVSLSFCRLVKRLDFGAGPKLLLWKCPTSSCLIQPGSRRRFPVLCAAHHTDLSLRAAGITRMDTLLPALGLFSRHSHLAWTNLPESCCLSPPRLLCVCLPSVLLFFFILCLCICAHKLRRHWTGSEL